MLSATFCVNISNVPFTKDYYTKIFGNVVKNALSQSDHITWLSHYINFMRTGWKVLYLR